MTMPEPRFYVTPTRTLRFVGADRTPTYVVQIVDGQSGNGFRTWESKDASVAALNAVEAAKVCARLNGTQV